MLRPSLNQIATKNESYYSVVLAVAKRAREIAGDAQENGDILEEKPVSLALDEIINGKYEVVEPEEIRNI